MTRSERLEHRLRRRIAVNVRAARVVCGLTLEEASHRADVYVRHWQKIESGEVGLTLKMIARLCVVLNVEPHELVASRR